MNKEKHELLKERDNLSFYYDKYEIDLNLYEKNRLNIDLTYFYHFDLSLIEDQIKKYIGNNNISSSDIKEKFSFQHKIKFEIPLNELQKNKDFKKILDEYKEEPEKKLSEKLEELSEESLEEPEEVSEENEKTNIYFNYIKNKIEKNKKFKDIIFNIGIIEGVSYYKILPVRNYIINSSLTKEQKQWWSKIYYKGLGEYRYLNSLLSITEERFLNFIANNYIEYDNTNMNTNTNTNINIEVNNAKEEIFCKVDEGESTNKFEAFNEIDLSGYIIPIGGGKDSIVTLDILNIVKEETTPLVITRALPRIKTIEKAGYLEDEIIVIDRVFDNKLSERNKEFFFNGHIPFSAVLAFLSLVPAYILNKKYIVLSNESSANESTVLNTDINHQYSKSFEFEKDFREYVQKNLELEIEYFSLLRPLTEVGIAKIFSSLESYHEVFNSCNVGSKEEKWEWCCNCPKCLFIYIILSPFLYKDKLIKIFGEDLFEKEELLKELYKLIGYADTKPFECVGTIEETIFSLDNTIKKQTGNMPILLKEYIRLKEENKIIKITNKNIYNEFNENNFVLDFLKTELKERLKKE